MNILHLTPTFLPTTGGAEIFIDELVRHQNTLPGTRAAVAVMSRKHSLPNTPYPCYPVYQPHLGALDTGNAVHSLKKTCKEFGADLIHCHYGYPTGAIARRTGLPWVVTSHGGDLYPHSHHRSKARHWSEIQRAYREANLAISISPFVTDIYQRELNLPDTQIVTIPNGIDPAPFQAPLTRPDAAPEKPYVFFIGRHAKVKNASLLLDAFTQPALADSPLHLVIAGDGDMRAEWEKQTADAGLSTRIHFVGKQFGEAKTALLQHSSAVLMPSLQEACPIVAIEAITCGKALLTSDILAFSLFMDDTLPHQQLPLDAPVLWAQAIANLPLKPSEEITRKIKTQAMQYSITHCAELHHKCYEQVLGSVIKTELDNGGNNNQ